VSEGAAGGYEFYGESRTRPLFSAEFDLPLERAATLAASELRLADGAAPEPLYALLPQPRSNPVENDLSRNALPYATALAGACPRLAPAANLLPAHLRATGSAAAYAPTAVLALLLLLLAGALAGFRAFDQRRYLARLRAEIARLEPEALRAAALDRQIDNIRSRTRLLDDFRLRAKKDLDAVNELTGLLAPPAWVHVLDLTRDGVVINGEAEQPAAFLKIIDASPYFENSDFSVQFARSPAPNNAETFRIHTRREAGR